MQQLQTTLKSELKQIVTYIHDILPQFPPEAGQATRQTRAVLPFLGTALNWLAGVALDDDIAAMRGHMSTLKKQQIILMDVLQKQNDDLSSYMHTANNRQDTLSKLFQETNDRLFNLSNSFERDILDKLNVSLHYSALLAQTLRNYFNIQIHLQSVIQSVHLLALGKLPSDFITPHSINTMLENVSNLLQQHFPRHTLYHNNANYYFTKSKVLAYTDLNKIYVTIKLPLTVDQIELQYYRILIYPVPIPHQEVNSVASRLETDFKYFAISTNREFFLEFLPEDYNSNDMTTIHLQPSTAPSCLFSIFNDQSSIVTQLCNFKIIPVPYKSKIFPYNQYSLVLFNISQLSMRCQGNLEQVKPCLFCILHIKCNCEIHTPMFFLPQRVNRPACLKNYATFKQLRFTNLALIASFFNSSVVSI